MVICKEDTKKGQGCGELKVLVADSSSVMVFRLEKEMRIGGTKKNGGKE